MVPNERRKGDKSRSGEKETKGSLRVRKRRKDRWVRKKGRKKERKEERKKERKKEKDRKIERSIRSKKIVGF